MIILLAILMTATLGVPLFVIASVVRDMLKEAFIQTQKIF